MRKSIVKNTYFRREPKYDYMKYWRVVRKYTMIKYDITEPDLELLMFLYSEGLFNYQKFNDYVNIFGWDKQRFARLKEKGFVHMWRDKHRGEYRMYELTRHGRHIITKMYKHLNYEEEISEVPTRNPIFKRKTYSHKVLAMGVSMFNNEVRKRKGLSYEEY
jgi:DNA-binding MarR family transcriptional regulator